MFIREQSVEVCGKRLNCGVGPDNGPPLILLHGVTRRWQSFVPVIPGLSLRTQFFAFDHVGHGISDRSDDEYQVVDYVETMAAALSTLPLLQHTELHLYGHSLGAMVAAGLASKLGSRVRSLILEDPPFETMGRRISATPLLSYFAGLQRFAGSSAPLNRIVHELADLRVKDPATGVEWRLGDTRDNASLRFTAKCLSQLDARVFGSIVSGQWLKGFEWESVIRGIKCPVLLLQADPATGGMLTDSDAVRAEQLIEDCTRILVPGAPHLIHWQKTEALLRYVQAFLESVLS